MNHNHKYFLFDLDMNSVGDKPSVTSPPPRRPGEKTMHIPSPPPPPPSPLASLYTDAAAGKARAPLAMGTDGIWHLAVVARLPGGAVHGGARYYSCGCSA